MRRRFLIIAPLAALLLAGCAFHPAKRPAAARANPETTPPPPTRIGTVLLVRDEPAFAVVDTGGLVPPQPGIALKAFAPEADITRDPPTAVLAVSAERRRSAFAADVVSGSPRVGDRVFQ